MFFRFFVVVRMKYNAIKSRFIAFLSKVVRFKKIQTMEGMKYKIKVQQNKYKFCYFQFNFVVAFVNASRTKIKVFERAKKKEAENR